MSAATKPAIVELLTRYFPQAVEFDDYIVETDPGYARITLSVSSTTGTKIWDFEERLRGWPKPDPLEHSGRTGSRSLGGTRHRALLYLLQDLTCATAAAAVIQ